MKTFYLIDGHAQLFRAYYAPFRDLTSPGGEPVKAVYVFTQMLLNIVRNERPDYLAVAFDVSDATTLRKGFYPEYKANRERSPEDLQVQYERIREVIDAFGLPVFELEGYEADDLIATIAERLKGEEVELRVGSKDKDLHQLLSHKVKLWDPSKGDLLDDVTLRAEKGYGPEQAVEIQALVGDPVDNVPGARGVGVKTAVRLIDEYGTAEVAIANADRLTPKLRENLLAHAEQLALTRRLVTLARDAPIEFDLAACALRAPDAARLRELFDALGFRAFAEQVTAIEGGPEGIGLGGATSRARSASPGPRGAAADAADAPAAPDGAGAAPLARPTGTITHLVTSAEELEALAAALAARPAFALDTETTALRAVDAELVGYSFAFAAGEGYYVPVAGPAADAGAAQAPTLAPAEVAAVLGPVLRDPRTLKVGQNLKYDINVLARAGIELGGPLFDTMVAAALLHPERRTNNMDVLAREFLGLATTPITDLIGKGKAQLNMRDVPVADVAAYAAEDADVTWRLYEHLAALLSTSGADARRLFDEVEMPLVRVLAAMERQGVELDVDLLAAYGEVLRARTRQLQAELVAAAGVAFNPDSPKQLGEVLFDRLGLPVIKRTKTGRSTDAEVLERLAGETDHPLPRLLLEYRELTKLLGTYLEPLPGYLAASTGRLHASFHQTGAATGRLSSSEPNIQNIPVRTEAGREIRRAFRAPAGKVLISADYSQVELRMLAHFSSDEELARAFLEGLDIHAYVASQVFGVPLEAVTSEQRRVAKTVNFGIIYGQSAFGLARTLGIPQREAGDFIAAYKARYTGLDRFIARCVAAAEADGYVSTILGRRRAVPEIRSRNRNLRQLGERVAVNTVIQGSAADLIKVAMVRLKARLDADFPGAHLLIQVHDELVLEAPEESAEAVTGAAVAEMTGAMELRVPLRVDAAVGRNWLEGKG